MQTSNDYNRRLTFLAALLLAIAGGPALSIGAHADNLKNGQDVAIQDQKQAQHPDAWITAQVKAKLLEQHFKTGLDVKVTTTDGVVKLAGYVNKAEEVSQADRIASSIEGVKRVQNDLTIR